MQAYKFDQAKARGVLSHLVMANELPFRFVEYDLFKYGTKLISPRWKNISCTTLKADCKKSYELERKKMSMLLETVDKICITSDMRKSGQKVQYMVVTAHFISEWKLEKRVLSFVEVP